jgi:hypothetical protein
LRYGLIVREVTTPDIRESATPQSVTLSLRATNIWQNTDTLSYQHVLQKELPKTGMQATAMKFILSFANCKLEEAQLRLLASSRFSIRM